MLRIEPRSSVTLADLLSLKAKGAMPVQTPHVGNLPIDVLVALQSGFHVRLVDTNVGYRDDLFYPHLVIRNGVSTQVAEAACLVTHATVSQNNNAFFGSVSLGQALGEAHIASAVRAFSGCDIVAYAEWLRPYREMLFQCLEQITLRYPKIWERRVDAQGNTVNAQKDLGIEPTWELIKKEGICGITVDHIAEGWVLPNPIAILVDIIVDAVVYSRDTQWALSGPSMHTYITQNHREFGPMDQLLNAWYDLLVTKLPQLKLPKRFTVKMVPAASWRFAAPFHLKLELDNLIAWYFESQRQKISMSEILAMGVADYGKLAEQKRAMRTELQSLITPLALWLRTQEKPMFATQYDVVNANMHSPPLYIHPITYNTSVNSLAKVFQYIKLFA